MLCSWAEVKLFTRGNPPRGDFATSIGGGSCYQLRSGWELVVLDYHHGKGLFYSLWKILWIIENLRWNLMMHSFVQILKYIYGFYLLQHFKLFDIEHANRHAPSLVIWFWLYPFLHVHALENTSASLGLKFSHTKTSVIGLPSTQKSLFNHCYMWIKKFQ